MVKFEARNIINLLIWLVIIYLLVQRCIINKPEKAVDIRQIELVDLHGEQFDWQQTNGKVVFLNVWASWCGPCMAEMPSIQSLYNQFNQEVIFILANTESIDQANSWLAKRNEKLPVYYLNHSGNVKINSIPLTYIIDKKGRVVTAHSGFTIWNSPLVKRKLRKLLKQPSP